MENEKPGDRQPPKPSRRTLRLTFEIRDGKLELVRQERLEMITPPQVGEQPEVGKHGGFWIELQDAKKSVLAHRAISRSLLNSVEVHSPDGTIERKFGGLRDGIFEVLLPDYSDAKSAVLIGEPLEKEPRKGKTKAKAKTKAEAVASAEVARFELSERKGGE